MFKKLKQFRKREEEFLLERLEKDPILQQGMANYIFLYCYKGFPIPRQFNNIIELLEKETWNNIVSIIQQLEESTQINYYTRITWKKYLL